MRSYLLHIVVLLIALAAFDFDLPVFQSDLSNNHQLANVPSLDFNPLKNPVTRENSKQLNYIAEPFIPLVILADSLYVERDFSHYLSVYGLNLQKEFFLLV